MFEAELKMLSDRGHTIEVFEKQSDDIRKLGLLGSAVGALVTPWNPSSYRRIQKLVAAFRPDVLHAHNTFPLISPSIFPAAQGAARVMTLHNYRLQCAAAIPLRDGKTCTVCIENKTALPAVRYGCYRSSRLASLPLALSIELHKANKTWERHIESFIALSEFQKTLMVKGGLPAGRVEVKPNHFSQVNDTIPFNERRHRVVYAGRLSEEKGVSFLIEAWRSWGAGAPLLEIIGDGPERENLEAISADLHNVRFAGSLDPKSTQEIIAGSRLLVLPSIWQETFGIVLLEAISAGTPIAVSEIGPLPEIARKARGLTFPPARPEKIAATIKKAWLSPGMLRDASNVAVNAFKKYFHEDVVYTRLMEIYESAVEQRNRNGLQGF